MEVIEKLRFDFDANTIEDAKIYIENRAKQLLRFDYLLESIISNKWGLSCMFSKGDKLYQSLYILKDYRSQGIYKEQVNRTILTSVECKIADWLFMNEIDYVAVELEDSHEYKLISDYYGNKTTNRTGVHLMNHIDEGLAVLEWIGASDAAKRAYCLHPMFQSDTDLALNYGKYNIDSDIMLLAMEYRSVANEYLSTRKISHLREIRLSPLKEVNDMLIADKIQNYKDFELYHENTHPRSEALIRYFNNWLFKLKCYSKYDEYKSKLK